MTTYSCPITLDDAEVIALKEAIWLFQSCAREFGSHDEAPIRARLLALRQVERKLADCVPHLMSTTLTG